MRIAVVNVSEDVYNLGCEKIANYHRRHGDQVDCGPWNPMMAQEAEKIYFSTVFTWDIPALIEQVNLARSWGKSIEIGGPAASLMFNFVHSQTGIDPHRGLDDRFEKEPGSYQLSFSSRGCPNSKTCRFCAVNKLEPIALEYDDFTPAPMLGDNNILATSWNHQEMVIDRLGEIPGKVDVNSGFDIRFFTKRHFAIYSKLKLAYWRFAFDTMENKEDVIRVGKFMRAQGLDRHQVMYYVLIGFPGTTPKDCLYRLQKVVDMGHMPYPMRFTPLNSLQQKYVAKGWTEDLLMKMQTFYQTPGLWMADSFENFKMGHNKKILAARPLPGQGELV